jgi:type II secretory pathway pseudopilin PulG
MRRDVVGERVTNRRAFERGFTLIEVLFAAAGFVVLTVGLVMLFGGFVQGAAKQSAQQGASEAAFRVVANLERDAQTAIAIFIPANDVLGNANADGHEVDFYTKDATRTAFFAAYRFDAAALTITRYTYAQPGSPATAGGSPIPATSFSATRLLASALANDPAVAPLLGGYTPQDISLQVGYTGVTAGNALVSVTVVTSAKNLTVRLLPGVLPAAFTIVGTSTPTPAPNGKTADGDTYAQESTCAKASGFDFASGPAPPNGTETFNVRPANCPNPTPVPHVTYGEFNCQAAPGAFISTDYSVSPPIDLVNYSGALFSSVCAGGAAAAPPPGTPNQVQFVQTCSQPAGIIGVNNATVPPTTQINKTDGCTNASPSAATLYDWQYESTSPACLFNASAPANALSGCNITARLIRSDDNGLFWFPQVCVFDGTFDAGTQSYTYALETANDADCSSQATTLSFSSLPVLYLNAQDGRV